MELFVKPGTIPEFEVLPGGEINQCKKEAIALAKMLGGNVKFWHNGRAYIADSQNVIETH